MKTCPTCKESYADSHAYCPRDATALLVVDAFTPGMMIRGKWRIIEEVGRGGMGIVYRVQHDLFKYDRAVKVINSTYTTDPEFVRRFLAEAVLANQINHPNVARVEDAEKTDDGLPYVVMEYVAGGSLRHMIYPTGAEQGVPIEASRAIQIASQVCNALTAAHASHIIHRDIKPDNLLITTKPDGRETVKVVDFGIAKAKSDVFATLARSSTQSGMFIGTPEYSSPEQLMGVKGDALDHRTDIYSLGVVLYEMLVGQNPFRNAEAPLRERMSSPPPSPKTARPDLYIPDSLNAIVVKALDPEAMRRHATAEEMRLALQAAAGEIQVSESTPTLVRGNAAPTRIAVEQPLAPSESTSRHRWIIAVAFALAVILGLTGYWKVSQETPPPVPAAVIDTSPQVVEKTSRAQKAFDAGNYDEAKRLYQEVLNVAPNNVDAQAGIQRVNTAVAAEQQLHIAELLRQADAARENGEYDTATAAYQKVLEMDSTNAAAKEGLDRIARAKAAEQNLLIGNPTKRQ